MIVYIAQAGQLCEGSHILGVFSRREDAVKCALSEPCYFSGGWIPEDAEEGDEDNHWENGCDFVKVEAYEVDYATSD